MIKVNRSEIECEGTILTLKKELVVIMKCFLERNIVTEDELKKLIEIALMSDEEMREKAEEIQEHITKMLDTLKELMKRSKEFMKDEESSKGGDSADDFFSDFFKE